MKQKEVLKIKQLKHGGGYVDRVALCEIAFQRDGIKYTVLAYYRQDKAIDGIEEFHIVTCGPLHTIPAGAKAIIKTTLKRMVWLQAVKEKIELMETMEGLPKYNAKISRSKIVICKNNGCFHYGNKSHLSGYATFIGKFKADEAENNFLMGV
jgi:hypothetical protein